MIVNWVVSVWPTHPHRRCLSRRYGRAWGYTVMVYDGPPLAPDRPPAWSKLPIMERVLAGRVCSGGPDQVCDEEGFTVEVGDGGQVDWAVWVDVDVLVGRMTASLRECVACFASPWPFPRAYSCVGMDRVMGLHWSRESGNMVVAADMHMVMNTGVFALRACTWSLWWLQHMAQQVQHLHSPFWENAAAVELYHRDFDRVTRHTRILPYGTLQALPPHFRPSTTLFLHFAGTDVVSRCYAVVATPTTAAVGPWYRHQIHACASAAHDHMVERLGGL